MKITVDINTSGETTVAVDNVTGDSCRTKTEALEKDLGDFIQVTIKPEFFQEPNTNQEQTLN